MSQQRDGRGNHAVTVFDGDKVKTRIPADMQIISEDWNTVAAVPYIVYMPERRRILMLMNGDYPGAPCIHHPKVLYSDDFGTTWSVPEYVHTDPRGNPDIGMGWGLAYLGDGKVLFYAAAGESVAASRWVSQDYGQSWAVLSAIEPAPGEETWTAWDPPLVIREPSGIRLLETGYVAHYEAGPPGSVSVQAFIRTSTDEGRSWGEAIRVPQWNGVNEVALLKAANGDIIGACRTETTFYDIDHSEGLAVCTSQDGGATWSELNVLYEHGRHHQSMVLLPDGTVAMTYVVRQGYPDTADGFPRFGVEAVVSRDHGKTWDVAQRYVLAEFTGLMKGKQAPYASTQSTSSLLLPDGRIFTAFGTAHRARFNAQGKNQAPRDIGVIAWTLEATQDDH